MAKRIVQHRPERDNPIRERNDLRQENRILKRQVARLKKTVKKLEDTDTVSISEETDGNEGAKSSARTCPECGSANLGSFVKPFSGKTVTACKDCKKWRSTA